ncbi:MAG: ClpXP protease specificity-enhancing factor SspB [Succinivibrio sp.]
MMLKRLTSLKPYLFTAYYEWMVDNEITPHVLVDATVNGVRVPKEYVRDGNIILSLLPSAIAEYKCLRGGISFKARFRGVSEDIYIPYSAMQQLIAMETGAALPIGRALEQLDISNDDELYPDEGAEDDSPQFEIDDNEEVITKPETLADSSEETREDDSVAVKPKSSSTPGFEFVKE